MDKFPYVPANVTYLAHAPLVAVLTCTDSRVDPCNILGLERHQIFEVRVAGNVASPEAIASLQYAVNHLDVKRVIVLAHNDCGAVDSAVDHLIEHHGPPTEPSAGDDDYCLNMLVYDIAHGLWEKEETRKLKGPDAEKANAEYQASKISQNAFFKKKLLAREGPDSKKIFWLDVCWAPIGTAVNLKF